jgi:hypothetical protein
VKFEEKDPEEKGCAETMWVGSQEAAKSNGGHSRTWKNDI